MTVESIVDAMTDEEVRKVFDKFDADEAGDWVANLFGMRSMGIQITTYAEGQLLAIGAIRPENRRVLSRKELREWLRLTSHPR